MTDNPTLDDSPFHQYQISNRRIKVLILIALLASIVIGAVWGFRMMTPNCPGLNQNMTFVNENLEKLDSQQLSAVETSIAQLILSRDSTIQILYTTNYVDFQSRAWKSVNRETIEFTPNTLSTEDTRGMTVGYFEIITIESQKVCLKMTKTVNYEYGGFRQESRIWEVGTFAGVNYISRSWWPGIAFGDPVPANRPAPSSTPN